MAVEPASLPASLGDFRIAELLGQGGSGVVYAAQWGHRQVALKVLRAELLPTASQRGRFLAEAKLLAAVDHPSVVKVLGFGELPDGRPYLAMEKLEGETLAARLARGPLALPEAITLFEQLASAVAALHERGLVHRDLKPENAFVVPGGYAVLLDFGIAKGGDTEEVSTVTQEGVVRGTPAYMAPERFFGAAASTATDLYELAVTLFFMLTGRLPWDKVHDPAGRLNPARPSELGVALPAGLEVEIMRALSTRPENRPPGVAELAERVRACAGRPLEAPVRHTADLRGARDAGAGTVTPANAPTPGAGGVVTAARLTEPPARRARWPWAVAGVALLGAGLAAGVTLSGRGNRSAAVVATVATDGSTPAEPEPVREEPPPTPPAPTDDEPDPPSPGPVGPRGPVPPTVWRYHREDTAALVGLAFGQLRQSAITRDMLAQYGKGEVAIMVNLLGSLCKVDVLGKLEWITLGVPAGATEPSFDIVAGGDWTRADLEACIGSAAKTFDLEVSLRADGDVTELRVAGQTLWLGWPDDHIVAISLRKQADPAWLRRRLAGEQNALRNRELAALRKEIDTGATLWILGGPESLKSTVLPGVPPPRALWAALWVADDLTVELGLRYRSDTEAALATKALQLKLKELKADPLAGFLLADATVEPRARDVRIRLHTDARTSRLIAKAVVESMAEQYKASQ